MTFYEILKSMIRWFSMEYTLVSSTVPVSGSRAWTTFLSPSLHGWNFGTQSYQLHDQNPTEWAVVSLDTGACTLYDGPPTTYANSNFSLNNQLRASNGRIFLLLNTNHLAYYEPADVQVHQLPQVPDPSHTAVDALFYSASFTASGKLILGTQSNSLPAIFSLDTDTLVVTPLGHVGKNRTSSLSYAYSERADGDTVYVAVGKDPWELCSLTNGVCTVLATAPGTGNMAFMNKPEGIVCTVDTDLGKPDNVRKQHWCADGVLYPYSSPYNPATLPFTPRNTIPASNPLVGAPLIDASAGIGLVQWRKTSTDPWIPVPYQVNNGTPVPISTLITLPDGSVLGSTEQYMGFFRDRWYGPWASGPSRIHCITVNGILWFVGYPNGMLFSQDPNQPWAPVAHGNFAASGMKYADCLTYSEATGRIYCSGHREREGFGGAIGWFDIAHGTYGGTFTGLQYLDAQGLAVIDTMSRVIFSGQPSTDPTLPNPPGMAQLVIYDKDFNEIERQTVLPGLQETGKLFRTSTPSVLLGLCPNAKTIYRHDVFAKSCLSSTTLTQTVGPSYQEPLGGFVYVVLDGVLCSIDPETLSIVTVSDHVVFQTATTFTFSGTDIYVACGATLNRLSLS